MKQLRFIMWWEKHFLFDCLFYESIYDLLNIPKRISVSTYKLIARLSAFEYENKQIEKVITTLKDRIFHAWKRHLREISTTLTQSQQPYIKNIFKDFFSKQKNSFPWESFPVPSSRKFYLNWETSRNKNKVLLIRKPQQESIFYLKKSVLILRLFSYVK